MTSTARAHFPAFSLLRFGLSLIVALFHAGVVTWAQSGNLAVQVFFALSGFLIGGILLRAGPGDLARFYYNRSARIWIPYLVAILLLVTASLLRDPVTPKWLEFVFYKLTFTYNFFGPPQLATFAAQMPLGGTGNHFWSICAEEQFYLVAPLLMILLPFGIGRTVWLWIAVGLGLSLAGMAGFFASITLGVLAAISLQRKPDWHLAPRSRAALIATTLASGALIATAAIPYDLAAPAFAVCLVLVLAQPGRISRAGEFLGGLSYPMYLNHWIGLILATELFQRIGDPASLVCKLAGVAFGVGVSAALYLAIDVPVRRNRDRFYTKARGIAAAATGYALVATGLLGGLLLG